jgi:hypothetical protein
LEGEGRINAFFLLAPVQVFLAVFFPVAEIAIVWIVVWASLLLFAFAAILGGIANGELRGHFISFGIGGGVLNGALRYDVRAAVDVLGCDLEAVEEEAGALGVEAGGAERAEDLGERELDGAAIFEDGEFDRIKGRAWFRVEAVQTVVEVAEWFFSQRV